MKLLLLVFFIISTSWAENSASNRELVHLQDKKFLRSIDDVNDTDAENIITKKVRGLFGLKPYLENYLLPFGYREGDYTSYTPSDKYTNKEAELQISLQYDAYTNLFGLDEIYSFSYTQKSMWQIYTESAPFRETNYNPEFFVSLPIYHSSDVLSVKMLRVSLSHQSNGQGDITELNQDIKPASTEDFEKTWLESRSRSWNYTSAMLIKRRF